jgi:hypothetical protein
MCDSPPPLEEVAAAAGARTLWFIGDSVLAQVAFVAGCRVVRRDRWSRPHWAFVRNTKAAGGTNCLAGAGGAGGLRRICEVRAVGHEHATNELPTAAMALRSLAERSLTSSSDVAVVTTGALQAENASHHLTFVRELAELAATATPHLPRLVYVEPLAAHFETVDGYWRADLMATACVPLRRTSLPPALEMARSLLDGAALPASRFVRVPHVWEWSAPLAAAHVGYRAASGLTDCTHYCLGSGVAGAVLDAIAGAVLDKWGGTAARPPAGDRTMGHVIGHAPQRIASGGAAAGPRGSGGTAAGPRGSGGTAAGPRGRRGARRDAPQLTKGEHTGGAATEPSDVGGDGRSIDALEGLGAPLLGVLPSADLMLPAARLPPSRARPSAGPWAKPPPPGPRWRPTALGRAGQKRLAVCMFGVAGVREGKAGRQSGLSTLAVYGAVESHITHVLEPAEARGAFSASVFAHSWAGPGSKIAAAVDHAYGARWLVASSHEHMLTNERVASMLLSATASLRLARDHSAHAIHAPYDLTLLMRHDVYFFRHLPLTAVQPHAVTLTAWCAWNTSQAQPAEPPQQPPPSPAADTPLPQPTPATGDATGEADASPGKRCGALRDGGKYHARSAEEGTHRGRDGEEGGEGAPLVVTDLSSGVIDHLFIGGGALLEWVFGSMLLARTRHLTRHYMLRYVADGSESGGPRLAFGSARSPSRHRHEAMAHWVIAEHLDRLGLTGRGLVRLHPTAVPYVHYGLFRQRHFAADLHHLAHAAADAGPAALCSGEWLCTLERNATREAADEERWRRHAGGGGDVQRRHAGGGGGDVQRRHAGGGGDVQHRHAGGGGDVQRRHAGGGADVQRRYSGGDVQGQAHAKRAAALLRREQRTQRALSRGGAYNASAQRSRGMISGNCSAHRTVASRRACLLFRGS